MNRFNLSDWAIRHRSVVTYFMLVIMVAGVWSYLRLGRSEDPDFTVKTMVVQVGWPGATVGDTLQQITDRLERKLQETPDLDYLKSYTTAGRTTIFVYLRDSTPAARVPDVWYQVRKKVGDISQTLPLGVQGPFFNDEFGDTFGNIYALTGDGYSYAQMKEVADRIRARLHRSMGLGGRDRSRRRLGLGMLGVALVGIRHAAFFLELPKLCLFDSG